MGRWDQYNIGVPRAIGSYADLTELYFELDFLKFRLEVRKKSQHKNLPIVAVVTSEY